MRETLLKNIEENKSNGHTLILEFYADWCVPCKMIKPVVTEIAAENEDIDVVFVNAGDLTELAAEYGVMSVPAVVIYKGGEEKTRFTGFMPKPKMLEVIRNA